ncbi:MAG: tetratricopeptide repeat protein [Thermotogaceae bacterium]|nr:tetratricopeptide repeat protein [Thermotogaceae bacterium]
MVKVLKIIGENINTELTINTPLAVIIRDIFYEGDWETMEEDLSKNEIMKNEIHVCKTIEENIVDLGEEIYQPISYLELRDWMDEVGIKTGDLQHVSLNGLYDLALEHSDKGLYDVAHDIIDFMLDIDPHYAPAYELKGSLLLEQSRIEEGLVFLDKAVEIDPWMIEAYSSLGEAYFNLGDYEKAAYYWEKEIEKAPENKLTYFMLAEAYEKMGDHKKAINTLEKLLHRDPESILALYEIAGLCRKLGNEEKAKEFEDKIASTTPKYSSDLDVWAKVMMRRGEYEKVIEVLEGFLEKSKLNTNIKVLLVIPYVKTGRIEDAKNLVNELKDNNIWYYYGKKELYNELLNREEKEACGIS